MYINSELEANEEQQTAPEYLWSCQYQFGCQLMRFRPLSELLDYCQERGYRLYLSATDTTGVWAAYSPEMPPQFFIGTMEALDRFALVIEEQDRQEFERFAHLLGKED
jgi:hypothetical protein